MTAFVCGVVPEEDCGDIVLGGLGTAYYPKLKEHYSTVKSYVDFFMSPSGSFKQLADTINSYENSIRTTAADVSFLFSK